MATCRSDAIPDLSDTQVIIYSRWDRSPDIVEDQVTYPIVTAMLGAPKVKAVRGFSDFGYSYVYVIFEDGTDLYWARSRTLEYLSGVLPRLPQGVRTELGPDATGLGWVYQYALVDRSGKHSLAELRSYQDWYLRYHLKSVPGRGRGGAGRRLRQAVPGQRGSEPAAGYGHPDQPGGRGGARRQQRGRRAAARIRRRRVHGARPRLRQDPSHDIEKIVAERQRDRHADPRQGRRPGRRSDPTCAAAWPTWTATGEPSSGIVVMRQGENALDVIDRVKAKIRRDRARPARRRQDRAGLRPLGADPALHRQAEDDAHRSDRHGRRW